MERDYEVLVVGGSHAGLSAAMALGRMRRTALVCDTGLARNRVVDHANNLVSQDGLAPEQWRANARNDLRKYETIQLSGAEVISIAPKGRRFTATLSTGDSVDFRKVVLAYGVKDHLPSIPGLRELWGHSIFHCPFCHGFEFTGQRIGAIANGKMAEHVLPMLRAFSDDIVLFTNGKSEVKPDLMTGKLAVVTDEIAELNRDGNKLLSVELKGGRKILRDGLLVAPAQLPEPTSRLGDELGLKRTEFGTYEILEMGLTNVPGVFVGGDIANPMHSVVNAMATGQLAGARAAMEILSEDFAN